jgi:formamidopyrimidine-DNA glycosylase
MPELPEVETTRNFIAPFVTGKQILNVKVRNAALRWPIAAGIEYELAGETVKSVGRRGKYLLFNCTSGTILIHLGMTGNLSLVSAASQPGKHDHLDLVMADNSCIRYTDPRRFGAFLWLKSAAEAHPLLRDLGIEPFDSGFTGKYLFDRAGKSSVPIKQFIMNSRIVTGVGNIYASESLFRAGIDPRHSSKSLSLAALDQLVQAIQTTLHTAIAAGSMQTSRFLAGEAITGYFDQKLMVYDRKGRPCYICGSPITQIRQGQRSTYFCGQCQQ